MTEVSSVHHINFLFADLEAAVQRFEQLLGVAPFEYEELIERGVRTARIQVGETWLVLVSPTDADGVPGRYMREHGEGFFLISFGVDNMDNAMHEFRKRMDDNTILQSRDGILNWRVADLPAEKTLGINVQLTQLKD